MFPRFSPTLIGGLLAFATPAAFAAPAPVEGSAQAIVRSDAAALNAFFGEPVFASNAVEVCHAAAALAPEPRYRRLTEWVLPSQSHSDFRITADFMSSSSPTAAISDRGGQIVSPALDLLNVAGELDQLDDLRKVISAVDVSDPSRQADRMAMLALLAIEQGDVPEASQRLEEFLASAIDRESSRDAVLLCLYRASSSRELAQVVFELAQPFREKFKREYNRNALTQQVMSVTTTLERISQNKDVDVIPSDKGSEHQWRSVIVSRAYEHGSGFPATQWWLQPGEAANASSHSDDYLFFASPLQGNYDVEADVTPFSYRDSHLMTAGVWVAPVYNHTTYGIGSLRGETARVPLDPPLADTTRFRTIHYRTSVTDSHAKTYFNSRLIHTEKFDGAHDPWVAIRSSRQHDGAVFDLRISGTPVIPESISLCDIDGLPGWFEYFHVPLRDELSEWKQVQVQDAELDEFHTESHTEIIAPLGVRLPANSDTESLLVYARPMLEDGVIEYDFWYEAGAFCVNPALGRMCFLLNPDGVAIHELTDGQFDRTSLRPDNSRIEVENQRGPDALPLLNHDWNHISLAVSGSELTLELNGQAIFQRELDTHEPRTFGLFHYADRERVRVRHVRWTGDWPKELPELGEQELAAIESVRLDASSQLLTASFRHPLDQQAFSSRRFSVIDGNVASQFDATGEGVVVHRAAEVGYRSATLSPNITLGGDFDVTLAYDQLKVETGLGNTATVLLEVRAENSEADVGALQRNTDRKGEEMIQCLHMQTIDSHDRRHYFNSSPVNSPAGQLRLSRRGDQLFYRFAENDSTQFRLIGKTKFSTADIPFHGIRATAQIQGETGFTHVRWKEMRIRGERLAGEGLEDWDAKLATLNQEREKLPAVFVGDFTKQAPNTADFFRWTDLRPWKSADQGLEIEAPGTDDWTSAGIAMLRELDGDLDITIEFDQVSLATPTAGNQSTINLQLDLPGSNLDQVSAILVRSHDGSLVAVAHSRQIVNGKPNYKQVGSLQVKSANLLRLARRADRIYWIVGSDDGGAQVISSTDVVSVPVSRAALRSLLHTGGAGRTSTFRLKSFTVRASSISLAGDEARLNGPRPTGKVPLSDQQPAKTPKSLFQSFFDLF